jgi:hypothetical protein
MRAIRRLRQKFGASPLLRLSENICIYGCRMTYFRMPCQNVEIPL